MMRSTEATREAVIQDSYPLSAMQRNLLSNGHAGRCSGANLEQVVGNLPEALDPARLEQAWQWVVRRHSILRSSIGNGPSGEPLQLVHRQIPIAPAQEDWRQFSSDEQETKFRAWLRADRKRGIDVNTPPLMRLTLIRLAEKSFRLIWTFHHLLLDGRSFKLVLNEVFNAYELFREGLTPDFPQPPAYRTFVDWQQQQDFSRSKNFWTELLRGFEETTRVELPNPSKPPTNDEDSHGEQVVRFNESATTLLKSQAQAAGISLSTFVQAAWALSLSFYSGKDDVVFGNIRAGRGCTCTDAEKIVGPLINTIPIRVRIELDKPVREWLTRIRQQQLAVRVFEQTPLEKILGWTDLRNGSALVESLVNFQSPAWHDALRQQGGQWSHRQFYVINQPDVPLWLDAAAASELTLAIGYDRARFDDASMARFAQHLQNLLKSLTQNFDARVGDLSPFSPSERQQLLIEWNNTSAKFPTDRCVQELFEIKAREIPNALAVASENSCLTYGELNERATELALRLQTAGVRDGMVGICLERSPELLVAQLAILKAGVAFTPLDPAYPPQRLAHIIADAQIRVLLTQKKWTPQFASTSARIVCLDSLETDLPLNGQAQIECNRTPDDVAYVIYTSGSTGQPKGVAIKHRSLLNLVFWHQQQYQITRDDRVSLIASPAFDASIWEIWPHLTAGASLHIPDESTRLSARKLAAWFCEEKISLAFVPTPLAEELFNENWPQPVTLRALLTGGDQLHQSPPASFPCPVFNHYGPTENTVVTTFGLVPNSPSADKPAIGRPIANTQVYLFDAHLRPVPIGVPGELHIGGAGLAAGYMRNENETRTRFVPNPFSDDSNQRLYQTGDLARFRPNGEIEFIGRNDQQIKIRGHRIEAGEIESHVLQHPAISQAAVVVQNKSSEKRLIAFVVPRDGERIAPEELRAMLKFRLPDCMVPAHFEVLDTLPITPNGKLDRHALAGRQCAFSTERKITPPQNEIERNLVEIWREVLNCENVGVTDSFFELGGHSLAAARVVSRVADVFHHELELHDLFDSPTIAGLAAKISPAANRKPNLLSVKKNGCAPLSFAQERLWFLEQLTPGVAFNNIPVAFQIRGALDATALEKSFREIIHRHDTLRTVFKNHNGQPVATVVENFSFRLQRDDFSALPEAERNSRVQKFISAEACRPFDLTKSPLLRAFLLNLGDEGHLLLLVTHHIACDGWSMDVLHSELTDFYTAFVNGTIAALPALPQRYSDFAAEQRDTLNTGAITRSENYWRKHFEKLPPSLELPADRPRPPLQTFRGAVLPFEIPAKLVQEMDSLCRRENVTLFMLLLAALQTLLHRYTGENDIAIGTPVAGRGRPELEKIIGLFLNTLVMRGNLEGDPTFQTFLKQIRRTALDALKHQNLPFEKLAESLQPERDLSRSPLFQVMFVLQNEPLRPLSLPGLQVEQLDVQSGTAKFDLTFSLRPESGGLNGQIEYSLDLFDEKTVRRMAGHFLTLLENIVSNPEQPISQLPFLASAERHQLLSEWNQTRAEFPVEKRVDELFAEQVHRTPEKIAAIFAGQEISYQTLNERAELLAEGLREAGVHPEDRVGICLERSLEMLVGLLAILKAGAAYVPLDPSYPVERLVFMLKDSQASLVLTTREQQEEFSPDLPHLKCLCIEDWNEPEIRLNKNSPRGNSDSLAYVIYTSGSTGNPKGVMVSHRNLVNFFTGMDRVLGTKPGVWLAVTSISFDISALELLWTLTRGFTVVIHRSDDAAPRPRRLHSTQKPIDFSLFYFGSDADETCSDKYRLLLEGAKFADENNFTAVWTPERHFNPIGGLYPNPSLTSAALAMTTRRIQIRAGSVVLPLHNPLCVAEDWAVVDNLSRGRVAISFASGWHANDFALSPENYFRRKEIMLEGIETIQRLWRGETVTTTNGLGGQTQTRIFPKPIQPELPAWLTSSGNARTFQLAGELRLNVLTHLFGQGISDLGKKIEAYRAAWRQGAHPGAGKVSVMLHTFLSESRAAAWEHVRGPLCNYLSTYREFSRAASELTSPVRETEADVELLLQRAAEGYFQTGGLFGSPEDALFMIEKLRALGVDEVACLIDFGIPTETVLDSLQHLNRLRELANTNPTPRLLNTQKSTIRHFSIPELIARHRVTHLQCTPSLAGTLVASPEGIEAIKSVQTLLVGGEALSITLARQLREIAGGDVINMYGPTETTVWSTFHRVADVRNTVPIGRPIANTEIYILDAQRAPVPIGVAGEIFIGGEGVARGYWNQPELTAEKFVPHPFSKNSHVRLYRTGDRARYRDDGEIEFLGRLDQQVKLRGHRIEPGEIETVLRQHVGVRECVVHPHERAPGDVRLIAYLVMANGKIDFSELRRFLESKLPAHVIPAAFVTLDELPLTPNGKINRRALPAPDDSRPILASAFVAPQTDIEKRITRLWQELLGVKSVGLHDNFFDLGGHSLLVVQMQARLREVIGVLVPVIRLFQHPTVATLAEFVGNNRERISFSAARERGRRQRAAFAQCRQSTLVS